MPTKEKASEALLALGIQTLDYPLNEIYQNLTQDEANMLNGLKSNYMINFKKVSNYYYVEKSVNLDDFITYVDQRNRRYMIALAIAQPVEVLNIRYHPSKRGVFILKCSFKVTHISRVVGFRNRYEKN